MPVAYYRHQCKHWWLPLSALLAQMQTNLDTRTQKTGKSISSYLLKMSEFSQGIFDDELMYQIERMVKSERVYGNMKDSVVKELQTYFDNFGTA